MGKSLELRIGTTRFRLFIPDGSDVLIIREPEKTVTEKGFTADLAGAISPLPVQESRIAVVVASCGGYPKDINFIQAHKAVHHATAFVKDGGTLIVFARCRDGIGSATFLPWFDMGGWNTAFDHLSQTYQGNGGTALAMMEKTRRINIFLVTDLSPEACRTIGVTRLDQPSALKIVRQHSGSIAAIPNASLLVRRWTRRQ